PTDAHHQEHRRVARVAKRLRTELDAIRFDHPLAHVRLLLSLSDFRVTTRIRRWWSRGQRDGRFGSGPGEILRSHRGRANSAGGGAALEQCIDAALTALHRPAVIPSEQRLQDRAQLLDARLLDPRPK